MSTFSSYLKKSNSFGFIYYTWKHDQILSKKYCWTPSNSVSIFSFFFFFSWSGKHQDWREAIWEIQANANINCFRIFLNNFCATTKKIHYNLMCCTFFNTMMCKTLNFANLLLYQCWLVTCRSAILSIKEWHYFHVIKTTTHINVEAFAEGRRINCERKLFFCTSVFHALLFCIIPLHHMLYINIWLNFFACMYWVNY